MTILLAILDQIQQHYPIHTWTHTNAHTATTPHWYNSPLTIHYNANNNTITITSYEPNDNNPNQDYPDVEVTTTIDLLNPNFLQQILQDYRLKHS